MVWVFVGLFILMNFVIIFFIVNIQRSRKQLKELHEEAESKIKENELDIALENTRKNYSGYLGGDENHFNVTRAVYHNLPGTKIMINLLEKHGDSKSDGKNHMIDLSKVCIIGRYRDENTVNVRDNSVSRKHCELYLKDGVVYLRDLGSVNKTILHRRSEKIEVTGHMGIPIANEDMICMGKDTVFHVTLVHYNG